VYSRMAEVKWAFGSLRALLELSVAIESVSCLTQSIKFKRLQSISVQAHWVSVCLPTPSRAMANLRYPLGIVRNNQ
jgi:hypothetical protein